ncbi:MAG: SDR family oxidoreductase [Chlamydiales bacterium]|nr:SDR family oxidoreductase [Chlamydiales bacterium]
MFEGKVAVVTGGNSGIGKSIAQAYSEKGAKVYIFGRDQKRLDETASSIKNCHAVQGDVTNLADLELLFKAVGSFDFLVANAGVADRKLLEEVTEEDFDHMVNINYKGLFFTVQKAAPYLRKGGSVVLISSIAAHAGIAGMSIYCSTKAAVSSLAKCFAADFVEKGVRVNAISPGYIDTPMFDDRSQLKEFAARVPVKRIGLPEEIAHTAIFLSTNAYVVGEDLVVDGGILPIVQV